MNNQLPTPPQAAIFNHMRKGFGTNSDFSQKFLLLSCQPLTRFLFLPLRQNSAQMRNIAPIMEGPCVPRSPAEGPLIEN
jgi:hypothetical protein